MTSPTAPLATNQQAQTSLISGLIGWGAWVVIQFFNFVLSIVTFGISSFFCTIAGYLVVIPWVIAIVTGHRALRQTTQENPNNKIMAIIGLVLGYGGLAFTLCTIALYFAGVLTLITAIILAPTATPFAP